MATIIIDHNGGLINEFYSNLPEQVTIKDFVPDDEYDDHAPSFAACSYAAEFGGLTAHFSAAPDKCPQLWKPLHRRPEALQLIADGYQALEEPARNEQALDAAFAAGYLEAVADLNTYISGLVQHDGIGPWQIHRILQQLQDQQLKKFFDFCQEINSPRASCESACAE